MGWGWLMKISEWNYLGKDNNKKLWSSEITELMERTGEAVYYGGNVAHTVPCAGSGTHSSEKKKKKHVGHTFINPLEGCSHYIHTAHLADRGTGRGLCSRASSSLSQVYTLHSVAICQWEITKYVSSWDVLSDEINCCSFNIYLYINKYGV